MLNSTASKADRRVQIHQEKTLTCRRIVHGGKPWKSCIVIRPNMGIDVRAHDGSLLSHDYTEWLFRTILRVHQVQPNAATTVVGMCSGDPLSVISARKEPVGADPVLR